MSGYMFDVPKIAACQEIHVVEAVIFDDMICKSYYVAAVEEARMRTMLFIEHDIQRDEYMQKLRREIKKMIGGSQS